MHARRSLGRQFGWLWAAYAASTFGTGLGFGAFPLIAILVLHSGPTEVSALAAAGLAVGAVVSLPLGPWIEFRRKRPVMITMDLIRFAALISVPAAFALGWLSFVQLLVVSVVVAAANIAFTAASGACLKALVPPEDLIVANARLESTLWTATAIGPPLGGIAIGLFGPVTTVVIDAISYLSSAAGIRAIGGSEPHPVRTDAPRLRASDLLEGWRTILTNPALRPLFFNTILVNGLIMATAPVIAVLMLGRLGFTPWQYGLAFGAPCIGGLIGSRLAAGAVAGRAVRPAQGHADRRSVARVLAALAGLHSARRRRDHPHHRRPVRPRHLHRRVQPGVCCLSARADPIARSGPRWWCCW
jgi:MFS family permease